MVALARLPLTSPRLTLGAVGLVTLLLGLGALRLRTDVGFRGSIGPDHPSVVALDAFLERFGDGMPVAALWTCDASAPCARLIDRSSLMMAHALARSLAQAPGVRTVTSIASAPLLVPDPEGFRVRHLVEDGEPAADLDRLWERALADPLWVRRIVSEDGSVAAMVLDLASSEAEQNVAALDALRRELAPYEAQGFVFRLIGDPVVLHFATGELRRDAMRITPVVALLIAVTILVLFRSWRAAVAALTPASLSVLWAVGFMSWMGWPETALTNALTAFLLVIGVCNALHLVSRYTIELQGGHRDAASRRRDTLLRVVGDVGPACFIAATTTAGGFASFATSGAASVVHFGLTSAFGVLASFLLSFTLLPALLVRMNFETVGAASATETWNDALSAILDLANRRSRLVLVSAAGLALFFAASIPLVRVDVDVYHLFGEHSPVVRWIRFTEERFRKPDTLELALHLPAGASVEEPAVLETLQRVSSFVSGTEGLGAATSIVVPLSWVNRLLDGDRPASQRPAHSPSGNAELLLLLSLHDASLVDRWLSLDRRVARVSLEADTGSKVDTGAVLDRVERYLATGLPEGWRAQVTGPVEVAVRMFEEVQSTQISSFSTALLVVLVLVAVFLGSLRWALAALVPTLLPVVVTLGWMGLAGIYLDMGTALVAAVVLGIGIDDSVHLITQYIRRRRAGLAAESAIRDAALHCGRAVVTTSIALSLGFLLLTNFAWASVANFGLLTAIAILGAMVADLILLPALIVAVSRASRHRQGGVA